LCELLRLAPAAQSRKRLLAIAMKQMVQIQRWQRQQIAIVLDIANQPVLYLHHAKDEWDPGPLHRKGHDAAMSYVSNTRASAGS
jgi:hypothetical protein